ncbi:hypothetical protein BC936DRAFT_139685 [Jimgerdemannia flammicorona]|uniref:Uncharacterized protein n=1 Tax=Jimgerdemannia flammicorona TaxID=994334 RepID=A0A433DHP6_9FUNG|nr:hypothetical protein BC936DRAFT_139685 [Jimgerdemannia flammicorona]
MQVICDVISNCRVYCPAAHPLFVRHRRDLFSASPPPTHHLASLDLRRRVTLPPLTSAYELTSADRSPSRASKVVLNQEGIQNCGYGF